MKVPNKTVTLTPTQLEDFLHEIATVAKDRIDRFIEGARLELDAATGRSPRKVGGAYRLRISDERFSDHWLELRFDYLDNYERIAADLIETFRANFGR